MRSSNPIFTRAEGFNGQRAATVGFDQPPTHVGYDTGYAPQETGSRMTIDSVVQKTGLTLAVVVLAAAATWIGTGSLSQATAPVLFALTTIGSLGAFALSLVNSFKRIVSPPLVIAFAALEGMFIGGFSKLLDAMTFARTGDHIVMPAVAGTVAAFVGTLAAYKFLNIKVGDKFRKFVFGAMIGMVALSLIDLVLHFFGAGIGVNGFGGIGLLFSAAGLLLGVFMLILDFDMVERGIAAGLPEAESWRAAFGLTVSLVWIYVNLLRILAILRD